MIVILEVPVAISGMAVVFQISNCDVSNLKHTKVEAPKDLETTDGSSYFDTKQSTYAVTGARYAGGYIGYMDIGSAASVGKD